MRLIAAVLLSLAIGALMPAGAFAQAGADTPVAARKAFAKKSGKKPAGKARKKKRPDPALQAYATMPLADRMSIQSDLIWTGDYNGLVNGDFTDRSIEAVRAFQKRNGGKETGVLSAQERDLLARAAKARKTAVGWQIVEDPATGARLGIPTKLMPQSMPITGGTRWTSAHGEARVETFRVRDAALDAVFEQQKKEPRGRQVGYSTLKDDFFVVSGTQGLKRFYVRAAVKEKDVRGMAVFYDQAMEGTMARIAVAMSSAFVPFPAGVAAGPPPRRKVDYGTGIVLDGEGRVLADRATIDGCYVVTLAGIGGADVIAVDKTSDLALLRVYGARNLVPVAAASATPPQPDVTLIGIADPQAQAGGGTVTTQPARLGPAGSGPRLLEPVPPAGFSGAAVVDGQGALVGLAQLRAVVVAGTQTAAPQARFVPVETVRAFLAAQKVILAAGARANAAAAKPSVVRVICARK